MDPTNRDVPLSTKLAILDNTNGRWAAEDPRCGVPKKMIPVTDLRMGSNSSSSILAIIRAYICISQIISAEEARGNPTFLTTIPPIPWQMNIRGRV
jgi:hypothetical protein